MRERERERERKRKKERNGALKSVIMALVVYWFIGLLVYWQLDLQVLTPSLGPEPKLRRTPHIDLAKGVVKQYPDQDLVRRFHWIGPLPAMHANPLPFQYATTNYGHHIAVSGSVFGTIVDILCLVWWPWQFIHHMSSSLTMRPIGLSNRFFLNVLIWHVDLLDLWAWITPSVRRLMNRFVS